MRYILLILLLFPTLAWGNNPYILGVPASGGPFLEDTLYESSSTNITSHTPDPGPGGDWFNNAATTISVGTEGVSHPSNSPLVTLYNDATPPSADYTVTVQGITGGTSWDKEFGACARDDGNGSRYCFYILGHSEAILSKFVEETETELIARPTGQSYATTTTYTVSLTVSGNQISATVYDGATLKTNVAAFTDNSFTAAGHAGMFIRGVSTRITNVVAE